MSFTGIVISFAGQRVSGFISDRRWVKAITDYQAEAALDLKTFFDVECRRAGSAGGGDSRHRAKSLAQLSSCAPGTTPKACSAVMEKQMADGTGEQAWVQSFGQRGLVRTLSGKHPMTQKLAVEWMVV